MQKKNSFSRSWSFHITRALNDKTIPEEIKLAKVSALKFLQSEFGDNFIEHCKKGHPIIQRLCDPEDEFLYFTDTLQKLKKIDCNWNFLLSKKLKPNNECWREGMDFVSISRTMIDQCLHPKFIEEDSMNNSPDIEVSNPETNEKFFIEVTKVGHSDERKIRSLNYSHLFDSLHYTIPVIPFSCKQLKVIQKSEHEKYEKLIIELKTQAMAEKKLIYFENEFLTMVCAPNEKSDLVQQWADENNDGKDDLVGLPLDFDDTNRIRNNKIRQKGKQLKNYGTGLIYMPVHYFYFWRINYGEVAKQLNTKMQEFPNLVGVVLYSIVKEKIKEAIDFQNDYIYSRMMLTNLFRRDLLFVPNEKYEGDLSEECREKIVKSFLPSTLITQNQ